MSLFVFKNLFLSRDLFMISLFIFLFMKGTSLKGNNLEELRRDMYLGDLKKKDIKNESANVENRKPRSVFKKMPPTYGAFHQHVKHAHLHSIYI